MVPLSSSRPSYPVRGTFPPRRGGASLVIRVRMPKRKPAAAGTPPASQQTFPKISQKRIKLQALRGAEILVADGGLTEKECQAVIEFAEHSKFQHQSSRGPAYGEAYRDNERLALQDQDLANELWQRTGLSESLKNHTIDQEPSLPIGLNPNIRLYKYLPGQRFGRHIDESVELGQGQKTRYTLLIYLSGSDGPGSTKGAAASNKPAGRLQGGATVFYDGRGRVAHSVQPKTGTMLLHLHGDECLEHEAAAVTAGVKYILRSDVVYGR